MQEMSCVSIIDITVSEMEIGEIPSLFSKYNGRFDEDKEIYTSVHKLIWLHSAEVARLSSVDQVAKCV